MVVVRDTVLGGHENMNALNDAHKKNRAVWGATGPLTNYLA